ncbi:hypothetical protein [Thermophilibacter mediterraneus]|uniref:hypothetical protein n=1 Tax=Thermophilibacter mediterraneus TaxID=1871031 RepID=UPI002353760D|nr:hypothetical protein [Thermophilibacter mediterraneus]
MQLPFSRRGVTYPMRGSVYYANLVAITLLLVGSVILYAVGQGDAGAPSQLRAAGSYALPVSIYLFGALVGIIFVRRASVTVPAAAQVACRAASVLALATLLVAMVPYLLPEQPQGVTAPAALFWGVLALPVVSLALGFVYALAWAPITGSEADLRAREAEERRVEREAEEERAAMKASSEARARRRAARARRAEEKRAAKGKGKGARGR